MFGLVSMVRGPHWKVNESEIEPWAADAAELLNRIPPAAFDRFLNASSILAVVAGVGSITVPRAMLDVAMANEAKARKRAAEEARANESDGVETVESSMEAPQEPDNSEARVPVGIFGDMMQEGF